MFRCTPLEPEPVLQVELLGAVGEAGHLMGVDVGAEAVEMLPDNIHYSIEGGDPARGVPGKAVAEPLKQPLWSYSKLYPSRGCHLVVSDLAGRPVEKPWRSLRPGQLMGRSEQG